MKTCRVGNTAQRLDTEQCFGPNSVYTDAEKNSCKVEPIVPEDIGTTNSLEALPGCNPIQPAPGPATVQTNCPNVVTSFGDVGDPGSDDSGSGSTPVKVATMATSASSEATSRSSTSTSVTAAENYVTPTTTKTSAPVSPSQASTSTGSTSSGSTSIKADDGSTWTSDGCYIDKVNPRTLATVGWFGKPMTNNECAKGCSKMGFSISGTENSGQCFCGNELVGSKKVESSDCNSPCVGDSSQMCGGSARLSVYKKSSGKKSKMGRAHRHLERHRNNAVS